MKTKIALITGGYTGEAEVSYKSAAFVASQLDIEKYDIFPIHIGLNDWSYVDVNGDRHLINRENFTLTIAEETLSFDLAFIILHGSPGEDGKLQGYFDMLGIKYSSCDALTCALTMNKGYTKAILTGIPNLFMAKSVLLFESHRAQAEEMVLKNLNLPYFVKPNAGGSSIGMTKVKEEHQLQAAIDLAFDAENTGKQVLVEEFVTGREFSQGIFRNYEGELVVFEAKYTPGLTEEITPADLSDEQERRIAALLKEIYIRLNCKGMVRIDYFLETGTDNFYFIEINTIPGQTPTSFIPQQVRAFGMTETEFYSELIETALK